MANEQGLYENIEPGTSISYNREKALKESINRIGRLTQEDIQHRKRLENIITKGKPTRKQEEEREEETNSLLKEGENEGCKIGKKANNNTEKRWRERDQQKGTRGEQSRNIAIQKVTEQRQRTEEEDKRRQEGNKEIEEIEEEEADIEIGIIRGEGEEINMPNPSLKLPTFQGKQGEDYAEFLDEIHMIAGVCGWADDMELQYVKLCIKGAAATWMKAIEEDKKDTLAKVREILKETFDDNRSPWQKHQDLTHLKQEKGQSVRDFALQVKEYDGPGKDDSSMISVFVSGVKDSIAEELEKATQLTFNSAVQRAEVLESIERRRQGRKVKLGMGEVYETRNNNLKGYESNEEEMNKMMEMCAMEYRKQWNGASQGATGWNDGNRQGGQLGFQPAPTYQNRQPNYEQQQRGDQYQRGNNGQGGSGNSSRGDRGSNRGNANQYMNNRIQGGPEDIANKQRGTNRVREYMRLLGEPTTQRDGEHNGKYCLIHDATSHTTDDCYYLGQYRNTMREKVQGRMNEMQGQGNGEAGPFQNQN